MATTTTKILFDIFGKNSCVISLHFKVNFLFFVINTVDKTNKLLFDKFVKIKKNHIKHLFPN